MNAIALMTLLTSINESIDDNNPNPYHIFERILTNTTFQYTPCEEEYANVLRCSLMRDNFACHRCIISSFGQLPSNDSAVDYLKNSNVCADLQQCAAEVCDPTCNPEWSELHQCTEKWADEYAHEYERKLSITRQDAEICTGLGQQEVKPLVKLFPKRSRCLDWICSGLYFCGWIITLFYFQSMGRKNRELKQQGGNVQTPDISQAIDISQTVENSQAIEAEATTSGDSSDDGSSDALIELGKTIFQNHLAKNVEDGCPICLGEFRRELSKTHCIILPCGEHALCANCTCSLKIEADKAKDCPQCPLCRYSFDPMFIESVPRQLMEKDPDLSHSVMKLPNMCFGDKIAIAERLLWTHRFDIPSVIDAIETLLDSKVSGLFFRSQGDLSHQEKAVIYNQARAQVKKLEENLELLLEEHRNTVNAKDLYKLSCKLRELRAALTEARQTARDEIYNRLNSVGNMGAEQEGANGSLITIDYHGMHVNEMRQKFKDHVLPILPVVKKVLVITGRGVHSAGKESKLRKALFKLVSQYDDRIYLQQVANNDGAMYVLWRSGAN